MDRDIVNALHYLYQDGKMYWPDLADKLWCGPDTKPTVEMFVNINKEFFELPSELYRFLKSIEDQLANLPKPDYVFSFPLSQSIRDAGEPRLCFVAMPYGPDWFGQVKGKISLAAEKTGFKAIVSLEQLTPGPILDQIWQGIRVADVVLADITDNNPNVFYEIGLAHALGKEVIVITQDDGKVPFDIRNSRYIPYDVTKLSELKTELVEAFNSVTARYPHEGDEPWF